MGKYRASGFVYRIIQKIEEYQQQECGDSWKSSDNVTNYLLGTREFSRSKYAPLRKGVEEAVKILREDLLIEDEELDAKEPLSESTDFLCSTPENPNTLNLLLSQSYQQLHDSSNKRLKPASSDSKAIDKGQKELQKKKSVVKKNYISESTSGIMYSDFGGIEHCLDDIRELIERPFKYPEVYLHLGVDLPRGILLFGPPGCGKTSLAEAISNELKVPFLKISAPEIVSGMSGESEAKLRELFEQARKKAPCLVFIDEIDAITPKRETAQREMERRIVAQLLTSMDDLSLEKTNNKPVLVIGATNRPDSLDPALRRAGRFDREIKLGVPDEAARQKILQVACQKLKLRGDFDFLKLARRTPGYVGADLKALIREAATFAINRIFERLHQSKMALDEPEKDAPDCDEENGLFISQNLDDLYIEENDFLCAIPKVQPSAKREGFAVVPDISWEDIGALSRVRQELRMAVVEPMKHPEKYAAVGITSPAGVLLWGPPGCGKTLLAKAVANESHSNFISIKGPELLNKYVGESERAVRQVFERARASAPSVIFFDELDALCPRRGDDSNAHAARVVNQILTELDGLEGRRNVYIIAASNRPDIIDPAMLRPGRLDKLLYVEVPDAAERFEILKTLAKKTPLSADVDLCAIAADSRCNNFSGADLGALIREAALCALQEDFDTHADAKDAAALSALIVRPAHFDAAFSKIFPSVSAADKLEYEALRAKFSVQNK